MLQAITNTNNNSYSNYNNNIQRIENTHEYENGKENTDNSIKYNFNIFNLESSEHPVTNNIYSEIEEQGSLNIDDGLIDNECRKCIYLY